MKFDYNQIVRSKANKANMQSRYAMKSQGRSASKQPAKSPQKKQIAANKENAAPAVDTRTAEEIDASYRRNLARFEEAKAKFETAFANKMNEIRRVYGEGVAGQVADMASSQGLAVAVQEEQA